MGSQLIWHTTTGGDDTSESDDDWSSDTFDPDEGEQQKEKDLHVDSNVARRECRRLIHATMSVNRHNRRQQCLMLKHRCFIGLRHSSSLSLIAPLVVDNMQRELEAVEEQCFVYRHRKLISYFTNYFVVSFAVAHDEARVA
jgi:hypothetical protein